MRTALPPEPASAGAARRFVTTALHRIGLEAHTELAELLVSELVTNAVLHAGTEITIEVSHDGGVVRVDVADGSRQRPRQRDYSEEPRPAVG